MADDSTDGVSRLGKSGIGAIFGGMLLAASALVVPFAWAATVVLAIGLGVCWYGDRTETIQYGVGVTAVGGIALVESISGVGLGLEPLALAALAVAFGVFDVLASRLLRFVKPTE